MTPDHPRGTSTHSKAPRRARTPLSGPGTLTLGYLSPGNGELIANGTTGYQNTMLGLSREIPASGTATDYIRAPNGATIAQRVGTANKQEVFFDVLGSTIALADQGANSLTRTYEYTPTASPPAPPQEPEAAL